jgi:hypothetical protein
MWEEGERQSELNKKTWGREVRDAKGRNGKGDDCLIQDN